jgi:phosphoglycolate phosphatase
MSRFDLVIFDLDGTLVDTLSDITEALNFTMRAMDMPHLSEGQIAESVGEGIDGILARVLGKEGAREATALFRSSYLENLCDRTRPYPGIPEMLDATSMPKVVATNKPGGMARRILAELGLGGHFAHVLGDDEVAYR